MPLFENEEVERLTRERDEARARSDRLRDEILRARAEAHELVKHRDPNINSALRDLAHARFDAARLREALTAFVALGLDCFEHFTTAPEPMCTCRVCLAVNNGSAALEETKP